MHRLLQRRRAGATPEHARADQRRISLRGADGARFVGCGAAVLAAVLALDTAAVPAAAAGAVGGARAAPAAAVPPAAPPVAGWEGVGSEAAAEALADVREAVAAVRRRSLTRAHRSRRRAAKERRWAELEALGIAGRGGGSGEGMTGP